MIVPLTLSLALLCNAEIHHLIVGTFGPQSLYTLEFDDTSETLTFLKNNSAPAASGWLAFSHDKKSLYGTSFKAEQSTWISYTVESATDLVANNKTLQVNSTAPSIYVLAAEQPPYTVYGTVFGLGGPGGYPNAVMSVDEKGVLKDVIQEYSYANTSGVHGTALNQQQSFLYSADDSGNKLWTHAVDSNTGKLSLVDVQQAPTDHADPRHVTVHPRGKYLFVVLEAANLVAQYSVDEGTGIPTYHNVSYSLIPPGSNSSNYWSDEVALSSSSNILWATTRSHDASKPGYIAAYSLSADGAIKKELFLTETGTSGGNANAVTPSPFSDNYVALTDSSVGFVEIWKLRADRSSADVVARSVLSDGGCCANALWYS